MVVMISFAAQTLVDILNSRFGESYGLFRTLPGKRYDKIVVTPNGSTQTFVHAFVECETGYVYKANGWNSPAKGVRYADVRAAGNAADPYGRYLYVR